MTNSAIAAAIEKARTDERASIVAWLNAQARVNEGLAQTVFEWCADAVEQALHGAHLPPSPD